MSKVKVDDVLLIISKMMNEENDFNSGVIKIVEETFGLGFNIDIINKTHRIKIELLEKIYNEVKGLK